MYKIFQSLPSDIDEIAFCHHLCFTKSLSVSLGNSYVKKMLEWFFSNKNSFLFHVIDEQNMIVGYCGGFSPSYKGDGSTSGMMKYAMKEALIGAISHPFLLFHKDVIPLYPIIFRNIFKVFKKKAGMRRQRERTKIDKRIGLVVIGVHPLYRNKGVFELLMNRFEKEASARNINMLTLSVKKDNERAVNAYKKIGWQILKEENNVLYMTKALPDQRGI